MKKHLIAVIVLAAIFAGFLFYASWPTATGTGVELKLMPVDPFDLIRGQYLTLRYEIGTIPEPYNFTEGTTVYVVLKKDGDEIYRPASYSEQMPQVVEGQVVIRGTSHVNWIEYGIESYFIERGAVLKEQMTDVTAYVKILPDGRASIVELRKDHEPVEFEYRNVTFTS